MYERVDMFRTSQVNARVLSTYAAAAASGAVLATAFPAQAQRPAPQVRMETMTLDGDRYVAELDGGGAAELTLEPALQQAAEQTLREHNVPFGAAVAISIPDGRVLAMAGHAALDPNLGTADLTLRPWAPAASVFKVVAAAALVESKLGAESRVCYHGGVSAVTLENLLDVPRLDKRCDTLAFAVGKSQNAIIAKLAARHLTPARLQRTAAAFGFGQAIPFDAPTIASHAMIPSDRLEFARAAAGFWHSSLSPLHGAMLAAAVGNAGEMPGPWVIAKAIGPLGAALPVARRRNRRVLDPAVAKEVGRMMELTTSMGTARGTFRGRQGQRLLPFEVAGKTGSLAYRGREGDPALPASLLPDDGYLGYSWFVGYAPADRPRIAFAVVLGNPARWRIKAAFVARRMVEELRPVADGDALAAR